MTVTNPDHYKPNDVWNKQPIEIMYASMTRESFIGYCQGCVMKYMCRYKNKNGVEDLEKAKMYLDFIISVEKGYSPLFSVNRCD